MLTDRHDPPSKQIIVSDEMTDATTRRLTQRGCRSAKILHSVAGHAWLIAHSCTLTTTMRFRGPLWAWCDRGLLEGVCTQARARYGRRSTEFHGRVPTVTTTESKSTFRRDRLPTGPSPRLTPQRPASGAWLVVNWPSSGAPAGVDVGGRHGTRVHQPAVRQDAGNGRSGRELFTRRLMRRRQTRNWPTPRHNEDGEGADADFAPRLTRAARLTGSA